ncbi:MAG: glycosyltransferase, partial [Deltaproteobacteria bacterium]|nr:glycosyltransferase [Deltaproteobacteria bacterium]
AEALAARGHAVAVFARALDPQRQDGETADEEVDGIPVRRVVSNFGPRATFLEYEDTHRFDAAFREFLVAHRADVVLAQHTILLSPNLLRVARDAGCAVVLALHDAFHLCNRIFLLDRDGRRCPGPDMGARCEACLADLAAPGEARARFDFMARALDVPHTVVAPSRALALRHVAEMPFLDGRVAVVEPGIRPLAAAPEARRRRAERPAGARVRLLFVGTWLPHKGLDLLVEAVRALDPAGWELTIRGAGVAGREEYVRDQQQRSAGLPVRWAGAFAASELPAILDAADVLVLPSRCDESYSRVVREARSAGLAVVAPATGGPAEGLVHEQDALLVAPDDGAQLRAALERLVADPGLLARLAAAPASFPDVADGVRCLEDVFATARARAAAARATPTITVAYVTRNGAEWLEGSLRAVRAQSGPFAPPEILAIDSGSTDGTLEILARHGVRTRRIAPAEFGHGRTRNLAVREATGDVIVFLTQDATPAGAGWLSAMVGALLDDPLLAGVWSRHAPRPGCHPMEWRALTEFPLFQGLAPDAAPRVAAARGNPDWAAHPERFSWFSNNSAAFRRDVLLRWPFPEVELGEDQAWARGVLQAGFRTALVPASLVLHSHAHGAWTNLQRHFDHARAMHDDLGQEDDLTLVEAVRAAWRETRRDVDFWARLRRRTRARVAARWGVPALAYHLGAFGGRWLGAHARRLPAPVMGWLSLNERARAGG